MLFYPVICCRIKHSSFPLPMLRAVVEFLYIIIIIFHNSCYLLVSVSCHQYSLLEYQSPYNWFSNTKGRVRCFDDICDSFRKSTIGHVRPAKIQISLHIRAVWSESSPGAFLHNHECKVSSWGQRRFWSDCANAQADLNLRWAHNSEGTISNVVAHNIYIYIFMAYMHKK